MPKVLTQWGKFWAIQGNVDPHALFLDSHELEALLRRFFQSILDLPAQARRGWVCGLGHGVLPKTPEENVRLFLRLQKEYFGEGSTAQGSQDLGDGQMNQDHAMSSLMTPRGVVGLGRK